MELNEGFHRGFFYTVDGIAAEGGGFVELRGEMLGYRAYEADWDRGRVGRISENFGIVAERCVVASDVEFKKADKFLYDKAGNLILTDILRQEWRERCEIGARTLVAVDTRDDFLFRSFGETFPELSDDTCGKSTFHHHAEQPPTKHRTASLVAEDEAHRGMLALISFPS